MSELPGKDKSLLQYDEEGLIVVPDFKPGNEAQAGLSAETDTRLVDVHGAIAHDVAIGRKYTIPSRSRPGVAYVLKPTGNIIKGRVELSGPNVRDPKEIATRTMAVEEYLPMHDREEDAERALNERIGAEAVDVVEAAISAGVDSPSEPEASPDVKLKAKVQDLITAIDNSFGMIGSVGAAELCSFRAGDIEELIRGGISTDPAVITTLRRAIRALNEGSDAGRDDRHGTSPIPRRALVFARRILEEIL